MILMSYQWISVGAIVLALLAGSLAAYAAEDAKQATLDGTVVKISGTELVMKSRSDKQNSRPLNNSTKIMLDGKVTDIQTGLNPE
jgi:hypothetical protein